MLTAAIAPMAIVAVLVRLFAGRETRRPPARALGSPSTPAAGG
jgi:hypothetical protein